MERNQIKTLLQKYYNAVSTREEENMLKEYFQGKDLPDEMKLEQLHFLAMADMRNEEIEVPADLESKILARLSVEQAKRKWLNNRTLITLTSIAAGLALVLSTFVFLNSRKDLGTYDDPQIAYAQSKDALDMVSRYFNQGTSGLANLREMDRSMEPLNNLERVEDVSNNLKYLGKFNEGVKKTRGLIQTDNN